MIANRYSVTIDRKISGPLSIPVLQELASVQTINRETLAAPEHSPYFRPIHTYPELLQCLFPYPVRHQLKTKAVALTPDSRTPVSVQEILRENVALEARCMADTGAPRRRSCLPGRARRRDFLVSSFFCNAFGAAAWFLLPHTPPLLVCIAAFLTLINIGLYWVFYHVMERY